LIHSSSDYLSVDWVSARVPAGPQNPFRSLINYTQNGERNTMLKHLKSVTRPDLSSQQIESCLQVNRWQYNEISRLPSSNTSRPCEDGDHAGVIIVGEIRMEE
jgi:hypothetical protein